MPRISQGEHTSSWVHILFSGYAKSCRDLRGPISSFIGIIIPSSHAHVIRGLPRYASKWQSLPLPIQVYWPTSPCSLPPNIIPHPQIHPYTYLHVYIWLQRMQEPSRRIPLSSICHSSPLLPLLAHAASFPVMYIAIYIIIELFTHSRALQWREETPPSPLVKREYSLHA